MSTSNKYINIKTKKMKLLIYIFREKKIFLNIKKEKVI